MIIHDLECFTLYSPNFEEGTKLIDICNLNIENMELRGVNYS